jgi:hypothetical protein
MNLQANIIQELNNIISLRNHLYTLVNGPRTTLINREEENKLRLFANQLDREVVNKSLQMITASEKSLDQVDHIINMLNTLPDEALGRAVLVNTDANVPVKSELVEPEPVPVEPVPVKAKSKRGSFKRVADDIE